MDTSIRHLGERRVRSPLTVARWMDDRTRVLADPHVRDDGESGAADAFEQAGPRERLFFDPAATRAGILTAGGLCPGLNDVVRGLVHELQLEYGVREVLGLRFGFDGLRRDPPAPPLPLTPQAVAPFHGVGGTLLGTARGEHDPRELAEVACDRLGLDVVFCVGGDGTLKGALALDEELARRDRPVAVVAIPKTIDNDIAWASRTFGFMTAVEEATRAIAAAHCEAASHDRGVGLVQLMGREAGFIAASASLACPDANVCLVPEVPFRLEGEGGLLAFLEQRLEQRRHAVLVVAEGAGARLLAGQETRDASGNVRPADVGAFLAHAIRDHFERRGRPVPLKYIDPSYMIRGRGANASDKIFCSHLAKMAAHAALAGKTRLMVADWQGLFVHVPLPLASGELRRLKPDGLTWQTLLATTGQPDFA